MKHTLPVLLLTWTFATGCAHTIPRASIPFELRLAQDEPQAGMTPMVIGQTTDTIYVASGAALTANDVKEARVVEGSTGQPAILVTFTGDAAGRLGDFTNANLGKRAAFLVNGRVVSAPRIMSPISGGVAMIEGSFTEEEASRLAQVLSPNQ